MPRDDGDGGEMNRTFYNKNEKGFSLIEVLVAMALFAIGSLAVVALYYSTSRSLRSSNELSEAVFIAEKYLNQTHSLRYKIPDGATVCTDCMKDAVFNEGKYTVSVDINPDLPLKDGTATITVVVFWGKLLGLSTNSFSLQFVRAETRTTGV